MSVETEKSPCSGITGSCLTRSRTEPALLLGKYENSPEGLCHTLSGVQFDQQLDKVILWMDQWSHQERCCILEVLLSGSHHAQIKLLWTVMQPALHRDFMYTAKKEFPKQQFVPISSFYSRKLKERQVLMREDNYHRINSAHLQRKEQLHDIVQELKLPEINPYLESSSTCEQDQVAAKSGCMRDNGVKHHSLQRSVTWSSFKQRSSVSKQPSRRVLSCQTELNINHTGESAQLDEVIKNSLNTIKSAPPSVRSMEMPPRRHMQEENIPIYQDSHQGSSLSSGSLFSLRERKKQRENMKRSKTQIDLHKPHVSSDGQKLIHWYLDVWNDFQRNEFLSKMLYKLDPRQHYYMSGLLCVKQYKDFISHLPEKLALRILAYLPPKHLLRASKVCKKWRKLCNSNDIWRLKCEQGNIAIPVLSETPNWKNIYYENRNTRDNWNSGKCSIVNCKGHKDRVLCVTFDERRMATGSVDKTIRIWNLDTGECIRTLQGHFRGVWCIKFFTKHLLISGSYDCAIKVWNLRDGSCVRTLLGHEGSVWSIIMKQSILASGSQDRTARIWDASRCHLLHTLKGHHGSVYCIDMDDDAKMVITGSSDKTVRLWSVESGAKLKVIYVNDRSAIMAISYSRGFIACSYGGKITMYKYNDRKRSAKVIRSYHEHIERIESLLLKVNPDRSSGSIISGGRDGELKYWDINKEKSIQSYRAHNNTINSVHCDDFRIATASYDNKIKIWDFRPT